MYRDLASAAESGHDFASRWLANEEATENVARLSSGFGNWKRVDRPASLATIRTTRVVPADLNALMLKMESDVSWIAGVICEDDASRDRWRKDSEAAEAKARFAVAANRRRVVLNATLWDEDEGRWRDLLLEPRASDPEIASSDTATVLTPMWFVPGVRASDFVPLWCGAAEPGGARATRAFHSLRKSGLVLPGGVACSLRFNGHQWDYPNAWAPLVHAIVEGLDACCGAEGAALARDVARRWLKSVAQILRRSGFMHEKYDARTIGGAVGGGGGRRRVRAPARVRVDQRRRAGVPREVLLRREEQAREGAAGRGGVGVGKARRLHQAVTRRVERERRRKKTQRRAPE